MRPCNLIVLGVCLGACMIPPRVRAQAPAAGPLVLLLPTSVRATALGNAWVAGRDEYSIFYNPAQLVATNGIGAAFGRYDWNGTSGAITSGVTIGPITYGWGVELAEFKARTSATYPFALDELVQRGTRDAMSFVASGGMNYVIKGFRTGVAIKYAEDRVDGYTSAGLVGAPVRNGFLLGDLGASHPFMSGTAALSVQNIGDHSSLRLPMQTTLGWAAQKPVGEFDMAFTAQVSERNNWVGGGGGIEAGYGWIEGWSVAARAGAHRTETSAQRPFTMGGSLNADRLVLDYALEFFEHRQLAHHIAIRWR